MHSKIILQSFDKIRKDLFEQTGTAVSDTTCAKELSVIISESFPYGDRSFRNLHNDAKSESHVELKQPQVVLALCQYLGYENYEDYLLENQKEKQENDTLGTNKRPATSRIGIIEKIRRNKILVGVLVIVMLVLASIYYVNRERWMIWDGDRYVEISFDAEKVQTGSLKIFKQSRIDNFQRINPLCETKFFDDEGNVKVWYGKNPTKELEYFSSHGLHPVTGKTLRPITSYMIKKHICD